MRLLAVGWVLTLALAAVALAPIVPGAGGPTRSPGALEVPAVVAPGAAGFSLTDPGVAPAAISLSWAEATVDCFTNYTVFYSTAGTSGPWHVAAPSVTSEATTALVVDDLAPATAYWWMVSVYYDSAVLCLGGATSQSSTVLAETQPGSAYLTSPSNTSDSIALAWTNNASYGGGLAFGHYEVVEVDDGTAANYTSLDGAGDLSATVGGLQAGHSYAFYVDTYDLCSGCAPAGASISRSNTVSAGTAAALGVVLTPTRTLLDAGLLDGFTCTATGGTAPYTFDWNFTNGSSVFAPGPATSSYAYLRASPAGYTVRCQVVDHAGDRAVVASPPIVVHADPRAVLGAASVEVVAGASVELRCTGAGGTAPLRANWTLGDGRAVVGAHATSDVNASYASPGTYRAVCTVRDALGVSAVAATVVQVHAAAPFQWLSAAVVLLIATALGAVAAVFVGVGRRRDEEDARRSALSRWVPPTAPATTVHGAKVCPKCGAVNVPLRGRCQACGAQLPRGPGP